MQVEEEVSRNDRQHNGSHHTPAPVGVLFREVGRRRMRFVYAAFALLLWAIITSDSMLASASADTKLLAIAILIAGAMAGGD